MEYLGAIICVTVRVNIRCESALSYYNVVTVNESEVVDSICSLLFTVLIYIRSINFSVVLLNETTNSNDQRVKAKATNGTQKYSKLHTNRKEIVSIFEKSCDYFSGFEILMYIIGCCEAY